MDAKLIESLGDLRPEEWALPTVAPEWKVRDVAAHLLDTVLRKLSVVRDGWVVEQPLIRGPADLAVFVNRMNREGVDVFRRLSPPLLIAWMNVACRESAEFHESLDPFAPAAFAVSWAGEERSSNWFDTARELTERWHHQQQIRQATGRDGLLVPELYHPVLDCLLRGLPHAYRGLEAPTGSAVRVEVSGACGGAWQIRKEAAGWAFVEPMDRWEAKIVIPEEIAWLVFTKGMRREEAETRVRWEGDQRLAAGVLGLTAVIA